MTVNNKWTVLLLACLGLSIQSVRAFESYEHKHLGDLAIRIAIDYSQIGHLDVSTQQQYWLHSLADRCEQLPPVLQLFYRDQADNHCPANTEDSTSYGDLVKLVDYAQNPYQLLEHPRSLLSSGLPTGFRELDQNLLEEARNGNTQTWARATTHNDQHFQTACIHSFIRMHREALFMAKKHYFSAMVTNALADHFLHDFFAPGHITTNRDNSHDAIALGMHDTANRVGSSFKINKEKWQTDLRPILEFIQENHENERGDYDFSLGEVAYSDEDAADIIADFLENHERIAIYGDDYLSDYPKQQLFMLLVQVRGLLDILECKELQLCKRNSLDSYLWYEYNDLQPDQQPKAGIPYGEYEIDVKLVSRSSNIFMASLGGEAPYSELGSSRLFFSAEVAPLSYIGQSDFLRKHTINRPVLECDFLSLCNFAPAVGMTLIRDESFHAVGPSIRLIKAFPKLDTQISAYYQHLKYDFRTPTRKSTYGLRFDTGFGVYTAFVGVGKGYFVDNNETLQPSNVVSFGLAVGLPFTRLGFNW